MTFMVFNRLIEILTANKILDTVFTAERDICNHPCSSIKALFLQAHGFPILILTHTCSYVQTNLASCIPHPHQLSMADFPSPIQLQQTLAQVIPFPFKSTSFFPCGVIWEHLPLYTQHFMPLLQKVQKPYFGGGEGGKRGLKNGYR